MSALVLDQHGSALGFQGNQLTVKHPDQNTVGFPIHQIDHLLVSAQVSFSHAALRALLTEGIPTLFCSASGWLYGHLASETGGQVQRRARQYQVMNDPVQALATARYVVQAKLQSQIRMFHQWELSARKLTAYRNKIAKAPDLNTLRGYEGILARLYFEGFRQQLQDSPFEFTRRQRHPAPDPINSLLSLGYTLLLGETVLASHGAGLDRFAGTLHTADGSQPSFALDMMEPFRVIVDRMVIHLARHEYTPDDFVQHESGCRCRDGRRGRFYQAWDELINRSIHWQGESSSYRRLIQRQAAIWAGWYDDPATTLNLWSLA
ncbi:CRISPR-associated endonuclease Cas1 [Candidatus Woesearchaeota archaeon]|nr:CRISPR-associated endonuclease Cas1 [Candidatus Woesearchaeota archaeon]